ncbi:MAG: hypothetical protein WAQ25_00320 [Candidatus Saccharimonas sp.]
MRLADQAPRRPIIGQRVLVGEMPVKVVALDAAGNPVVESLTRPPSSQAVQPMARSATLGMQLPDSMR